jgi:hypothetical protein
LNPSGISVDTTVVLVSAAPIAKTGKLARMIVYQIVPFFHRTLSLAEDLS